MYLFKHLMRPEIFRMDLSIFESIGVFYNKLMLPVSQKPIMMFNNISMKPHTFFMWTAAWGFCEVILSPLRQALVLLLLVQPLLILSALNGGRKSFPILRYKSRKAPPAEYFRKR